MVWARARSCAVSTVFLLHAVLYRPWRRSVCTARSAALRSTHDVSLSAFGRPARVLTVAAGTRESLQIEPRRIEGGTRAERGRHGRVIFTVDPNQSLQLAQQPVLVELDLAVPSLAGLTDFHVVLHHER